jgi:hypothetical protein
MAQEAPQAEAVIRPASIDVLTYAGRMTGGHWKGSAQVRGRDQDAPTPQDGGETSYILPLAERFIDEPGQDGVDVSGRYRIEPLGRVPDLGQEPWQSMTGKVPVRPVSRS